MVEAAAPAYYVIHRRGVLRDVMALLHPPYTAWHLSYVVIGATIGARVDWGVLGATLVAFFLAVGIAAHALDELCGRPLRTDLPSSSLIVATGVSLAGAVGLGAVGVARVGWALAIFVVVGPLLVLGYNLELFGGRMHSDLVFALGWGSFPVLTAAYAQEHTVRLAAVAAAAAAALLSGAQRRLSTPARLLRRRAGVVEGSIQLVDGKVIDLDMAALLGPIESTLRLVSWAVVALAVSLALARS